MESFGVKEDCQSEMCVRVRAHICDIIVCVCVSRGVNNNKCFFLTRWGYQASSGRKTESTTSPTYVRMSVSNLRHGWFQSALTNLRTPPSPLTHFTSWPSASAKCVRLLARQSNRDQEMRWTHNVIIAR